MVTELVRQIATLVGDHKGILVGALEAFELENDVDGGGVCQSLHDRPGHPACTVVATHLYRSRGTCSLSGLICEPLAEYALEGIATGMKCDVCHEPCADHWSVVPV